MKVATGTVIDGKVVVEAVALAEGATVTVMVRDDEETFMMTNSNYSSLLLPSNAETSFLAMNSWKGYAASGEFTSH